MLHVEKQKHSVCVKAVHTHTRSGSDGVSTGNERLSMVQADENIHGPAQ